MTAHTYITKQLTQDHGAANRSLSVPRFFPGMPWCFQSMPQLVRSMPRFVQGMPRCAWSMPRFVCGMPPCARRMPQFVWSMLQFVQGMPWWAPQRPGPVHASSPATPQFSAHLHTTAWHGGTQVGTELEHFQSPGFTYMIIFKMLMKTKLPVWAKGLPEGSTVAG